MKSVVAIIGRPNAGKSTLFNRLTRSRNALVDNFPGVTRDRLYGYASWNGVDFTLVDTGGFDDTSSDFSDQIRHQIHEAIEESDAIVYLLDGKAGVSPFDMDLIRILREQTKPILYIVNKIDSEHKEDQLYDFYRLGVDRLHPVSAEHGYGIHDFLDELIEKLPIDATRADEKMIRVAVVGRPNVGKSSLINAIIGSNRLVTSEIPGTTRDAIDLTYQHDGKSYVIIDTAGIRRKSRVSEKIEKFSVIKAIKSIENCDIALIIMDAEEGITEQDVTIAGYAYERGCGCILIVNKWDMTDRSNRVTKKFNEWIREEMKYLSFAPILTTSAKTGLRVPEIFKWVDQVYTQYSNRVGTGQLNKVIQNAVEQHEPPMHKGRRIKYFYATQVSSSPPSIVCFVNYPDAVHFSYERYLINRIREDLGLNYTPIRLMFRPRKGK